MIYGLAANFAVRYNGFGNLNQAAASEFQLYFVGQLFGEKIGKVHPGEGNPRPLGKSER